MMPSYDQIVLDQLWHGYYSLGLIRRHRPDIAMIAVRLSRRDHWTELDYRFHGLDGLIQYQLSQHRTVLIVTWEEDIIGAYDQTLTACLNQYREEPVYLVSEMDQLNRLIYSHQMRLEIKQLELPFVLANDCLCYDRLRQQWPVEAAPTSHKNFLCMIGRPDPMKIELALELRRQELHEWGMIVANQFQHPELRGVLVRDQRPPRYDLAQLTSSHRKEAGQVDQHGILISSNVENFRHIESTYGMPLIINPESTMGIFPPTEKSIWPVLLGRLFLILGPVGVMGWVQRFYGSDMSTWVNLDYDRQEAYSLSEFLTKRQQMLHDNQELIQHAPEVARAYRSQLDEARQEFPRNIWRFFKQQIDSLP
jgi:hypothetical protein